MCMCVFGMHEDDILYVNKDFSIQLLIVNYIYSVCVCVCVSMIKKVVIDYFVSFICLVNIYLLFFRVLFLILWFYFFTPFLLVLHCSKIFTLKQVLLQLNIIKL